MARNKNIVKGGHNMWLIIFKVNNTSGTEGRYKNVEIAKRHLRRLQKRYIGTQFDLKQVNKKVKI